MYWVRCLVLINFYVEDEQKLRFYIRKLCHGVLDVNIKKDKTTLKKEAGLWIVNDGSISKLELIKRLFVRELGLSYF